MHERNWVQDQGDASYCASFVIVSPEHITEEAYILWNSSIFQTFTRLSSDGSPSLQLQLKLRSPSCAVTEDGMSGLGPKQYDGASQYGTSQRDKMTPFHTGYIPQDWRERESLEKRCGPSIAPSIVPRHSMPLCYWGWLQGW